MNIVSKPLLILMADDDADDALLVREALAEGGRQHEWRVVRDGEELLDYLLRRGPFAAPDAARAQPRPPGPENAQKGRPRGAAGIEVRSPPEADSGGGLDHLRRRRGH